MCSGQVPRTYLVPTTACLVCLSTYAGSENGYAWCEFFFVFLSRFFTTHNHTRAFKLICEMSSDEEDQRRQSITLQIVCNFAINSFSEFAFALLYTPSLSMSGLSFYAIKCDDNDGAVDVAIGELIFVACFEVKLFRMH